VAEIETLRCGQALRSVLMLVMGDMTLAARLLADLRRAERLVCRSASAGSNYHNPPDVGRLGSITSRTTSRSRGIQTQLTSLTLRCIARHPNLKW